MNAIQKYLRRFCVYYIRHRDDEQKQEKEIENWINKLSCTSFQFCVYVPDELNEKDYFVFFSLF